MVDRINNAGISHGRKIDTARTSNSANSPVSADNKAEAAATAASPQESNLLERTRAGIDASEGIDRQKVDAIKTAIRNGEFAIDAKAVAKAYVDLEMMTGN